MTALAQTAFALTIALWVAPLTEAASDGPCGCAALGRTEASNCYYTDPELDEWIEPLSSARYSGNAAHAKLIDHIYGKLSEIKGVSVDRQAVSFTRWDPDVPPVLEAGSERLPGLVWPLPYSGFTGPNGVSGELYYEGAIRPDSFRFDRRRHKGKIVVVKLKMRDLWKEIIVLTNDAIPGWRNWFPVSYQRAIRLEADVPLLCDGQNAGILGLIVIVDEDPKVAVDQYVPFTRKRQDDTPAVFVDRELGHTLAEMAKKGASVTLRHTGKLTPASTSHLIATLPATPSATCAAKCKPPEDPGGKPVCEAVVVATHTDGPNFFEENGGVALWSLLRKFSEQECRPRDLAFVFAAAHFAEEPGSMNRVIELNPKLFERTRSALVIEHLGAKRASSDWNPEEKPELALILTTKWDDSLNRLAKTVTTRHVKSDAWLRPTYWVKPKYFLFGEGQFLEARKIPTIGYLTNPPYLLSRESDHRRWFSPALMCKQIDMFRDLIEGMLAMESVSP